MRIEGIDFREESGRALGKGRKVRTVMCDEITLRMMRDYISGRSSGYVFLSHGHPIEPQAVQRVFWLYAPAGITPQKIRHRHETELYKASHDLMAVQENLGPTSIQTTQIYLHNDLEERKKSYQSFPLAVHG